MDRSIAVEGAPSGLRQSATRASALSGAQRTVGSVAVLGFAAASGVLDGPQTDALRSGVTWIIGRQVRVADAPTALTDPLSVLGIALGARALADPSLIPRTLSWVAQVGDAAGELSGAPECQRALFAGAAVALGGALHERVARNADVSDMRLAFVARGLLSMPSLEAFEADATRVLEQARTSGVESLRSGLCCRADGSPRMDLRYGADCSPRAHERLRHWARPSARAGRVAYLAVGEEGANAKRTSQAVACRQRIPCTGLLHVILARCSMTCSPKRHFAPLGRSARARTYAFRRYAS